MALIGLLKAEGKTLSEDELSEPRQQLNVWEGTLESRFKLSGSPVEITTLCHPDKDELAYRLQSPLFSEKKLGVRICFPFPSVAFGKEPAVWDVEDGHRSRITEVVRMIGSLNIRQMILSIVAVYGHP